MARRSHWLIPLTIALVAIVVSGLVLSSGAAPGPVRGGSSTAEPSDTVTATVSPVPSAHATETARAADQAGARGTTSTGPILSQRRIGHANGVDAVAPAPAVPTELAPTPTRPPAEPTAPAAPPRATEVAAARIPYSIVRSGRPTDSTDSTLAYDGDPETGWTAGTSAGTTYAWFDLGDERPVTVVRWLQTATDGAVTVQVSADREQWTTVAREQAVPAGEWQTLTVGERARYVRLVFSDADDQAAPPDLAEIEIFGPPGSEPSVTSSGSTSAAAQGARPPQGTAGGASVTTTDRGAAPSSAGSRPAQSGEPVRIETSPGETDCDEGGGADCVVRGERVDVHQDCGTDSSTCQIDVSVDGGLAACDAGGGARNRAGRGNGARAGDGGTCDAEASGGTVDIGDVNP